MNNSFELIWKKLDNQLSESESKEFDLLLSTNEEFRQEFNYQLSVSKALKNLPVLNAPEGIIANVMNAVQKLPSPVYSRFPAFKNIVIGLGIAFIIAAILLVVLSQQSTLNANHTYASYINQLTTYMTIPDEMLALSPYLALLFPVVGLIWLDKFIAVNKSKMKLTH